MEEMGGETQDVEVSALKKIGLDALIEKIQLQAELLDLKANPDREAEGTVIEAKLDKGRGPVATILVNRGTLKVGDVFVVGAESGKVRALINDKGQQVKEAGPAVPVEVLGLSGVPMAGDPLQVVENEARAREVAEYRSGVALQKRTTQAPASLESMFSALKEKQAMEYPLVVKADTQGTVEAIVAAINKISTDDIKARVLHSGVGGITESDVTLAAAAGAPIIGFNVRPNAKAREIAERNKVAFKYYDVIYDLTDEVRAGMAGQLGPEAFETVVGRAEIKEVFSAGKHGKAAGLLVTEGAIRKALKARITRDDVIIYQGEIASLRRFKDDVAEVRAGLECGVTFSQNFTDIKAGDYLETFEVEDARAHAVMPESRGDDASHRLRRRGGGAGGAGHCPPRRTVRASDACRCSPVSPRRAGCCDEFDLRRFPRRLPRPGCSAGRCGGSTRRRGRSRSAFRSTTGSSIRRERCRAASWLRCSTTHRGPACSRRAKGRSMRRRSISMWCASSPRGRAASRARAGW